MYSVPSISTNCAATGKDLLLNAADRDYLRIDRKLTLDWIYENCGSADIPKATVLLGYTAKSGGIFFYGDDLEQLQFRPHTPWASKDGKKPKYRTPTGDYDAYLAKHPEIEAYWADLDALRARCFAANGKPYLIITEGCIKAITGCMHGIPTMGLMGVDMGLTPKAQGKPDLVPVLKRLAEAGFGFIIAFDSDVKPETVAGVAASEARLTKTLKSYGCDVLSVTGTWNHEDGKGMDDFINNKGIEAFRAVLIKARSVGSEPHDTGSKRKGKQPPAQSVIASELAEIYRERLAWQSEYQQWLSYEGKLEGVWSVETEETIKGLISAHLQAQDLGGFTAGYVSGIATLLKSDLEVKDWNEQEGLIPLEDGVLTLTNKQLLPHQPGYRFTYRIPLKWSDRAMGCTPIEEFLCRIAGSPAVADVLLAWLSAVVTRRSDLQRYLELIGGGGTGKSTFMALCRALAGNENTVSSQLKHLENNQFETAKFYGKMLALFPDSEKWQGEVSVLKQLTGGDPIRYERKGVQQCRDFIYKGMAMLSANEAIEGKDRTSGLERRKLTIPLENRIPEYVGRDLMEEFKPYLAGLLKRVLDIPREEVTRLIKHTEREVPELASRKWEQMCQTNDLARWLDDCVVLDPNLMTYVGNNNASMINRWLYPNYCADRETQHEKPLSMKSFRPNLMDLLKNQLKAEVSVGEDKNGRFIKGIALRCMAGQYYPRPITQKPFGGGGWMADDGGLVVAESIGSGGLDGLDGLNQNYKITTKLQSTQLDLPFSQSQNNSCDGVSENNPPHPPNPPLAGVLATSEPPSDSPQPTTTLDDVVARLKLALTWAEIYEVMGGADKGELREQLKEALPPDERKRISYLHAGAIKTIGTRCRYLGKDHVEHLGGLDLVVAEVDYCKAYHLTEITCIRPDGSYTTRLQAKDLNAFLV